MKATMGSGELREMSDCYITTPFSTIKMRVLPDISDTKSAQYSPETIIGRAQPVTTYSHSEARNISWSCHFIVCKQGDWDKNLSYLRALEACVYPKDGGSTPYEPPPICKIKCGKMLADSELCVILKSYSVKFPTDVVYDETTYIPYKMDVDLSFEVAYDSNDLPGADRIFSTGR